MKRWETALITGGSTGIGASLAKELVKRGTKVVICARRQDQLEAAAKEIGAIPIQGDMGDPERARQVPAGGFAGRFFVTEWNASIHFAALEARLTWLGAN